jgi:hypothetical protein
MIRLSKMKGDDVDILVFDVRPKQICLELNREIKVYLGRITPRVDDDGREWFKWMSRWGHNCGEEFDIAIAQTCIELCAKGMYK